MMKRTGVKALRDGDSVWDVCRQGKMSGTLRGLTIGWARRNWRAACATDSLRSSLAGRERAGNSDRE